MNTITPQATCLVQLLETHFARTSSAKGRLENAELNKDLGHYSGREFSELVFRDCLQRTRDILLIGCEALGLPETRAELSGRWEELDKKGAIEHMDYLPEVESFHSEAESLLWTAFEALRAISGQPSMSPIEAFQIDRLENLLRSAPALLRRRNVVPKKEKDVQQVLSDYFHVAFPDYLDNVTVHGFTKNFKPDGGVRSIHTAIEYKFARSQEELKTAVSGVLEDTAGYEGSKDWTRFISLIYMTEPFEIEERLELDLSRVGAHSWKGILVHDGAMSKAN